jgi:hypothetical protein
MAVTINASTSAGLVTSADTSGDLNIQSGGSTKIAVTSAGANIVGTLTVNGVAPTSGKVLQVVNATYATETTNSTTTFADTGLTATITPTSATSKILVFVSMAGVGKGSASAASGARFQLLRGASVILNMERMASFTDTAVVNYIGSVSSTYLDSPAATSATTYKVQFANRTAASTIVLQVNDGTVNATSTITLMEIAA